MLKSLLEYLFNSSQSEKLNSGKHSEYVLCEDLPFSKLFRKFLLLSLDFSGNGKLS